MKRFNAPGRLRSRRGIAIESAVLFILIILALCTLIITLSLMGRHQLSNLSAEIRADIEKEQICEDFLSYVHAVTVTKTDGNGVSPSPSTPPAEGTESFYNYISKGNNADIARRYDEYYGENGRYSCFDTRNVGNDGTVTFTLYALNAQTKEVILCAVATKTPETVNPDNGAVIPGTVTLVSCLSAPAAQ